jgi:hypothetical protein
VNKLNWIAVEISLTNRHLNLKEENSKLKQVHERVSKETNPHTTSKCISTDIRGLMQKVHPKLKSNLCKSSHKWIQQGIKFKMNLEVCMDILTISQNSDGKRNSFWMQWCLCFPQKIQD